MVGPPLFLGDAVEQFCPWSGFVSSSDGSPEIAALRRAIVIERGCLKGDALRLRTGGAIKWSNQGQIE